MSYTVEITEHTTRSVLSQSRLRGKDVEKVCKMFDMEPKQDYDNADYVEIDVPTVEEEKAVVFRQSFSELDLAKVVIMLNAREKPINV